MKDMPLPDILQQILKTKQEELDYRRSKKSMQDVRSAAADEEPQRGFFSQLSQQISRGNVAIIAECKRASPSKGIIRTNYQPVEIARSYACAGATCLSVLTDIKYFQGDDNHLRQARASCKLPVLRKDFMIDPYQIFESRALGADCVLIIVAALSDLQMNDLVGAADECGLDTLVEVHNREELERALMLRTPLIGINNRDLCTFRTDLQTTLSLLTDVLQDRTVVTESGIHTPDDVELMRKNHVKAFLVGESFMSAGDPGARLKELFFDT